MGQRAVLQQFVVRRRLLFKPCIIEFQQWRKGRT